MVADVGGITVAVLVKSVPVGDRFLRPEGGHLTRAGIQHGLDPVNEVAVEWALQEREAGRIGRVVAVTLGPPEAMEAVRKAVAMGCDDAVHVTDPAFAGADVGTTARALAAVIRRLDAKVAAFGNESLDGSSGAVPAAVAALLSRPVVSLARSGRVEHGNLRAERDLGYGPEIVEADLPVVVSFVAGEVEPRFPTLKGTLKARAAPLTMLSAADLGVEPRPRRERVLRLEDVPQEPKATKRLGLEDGVEAVIGLLIEEGVIDA